MRAATATKIIHQQNQQNKKFIKQKSNLRYQPKLRNPIAQSKIHKKEEADPFLILLQSAFSFFSGGTKIKFRVSKPKPKPAVKRISKQFPPKPKKLLGQRPIRNTPVKTSRPPLVNDSNKQSKQVFPHSDGFPLKVNKAKSPQDVSHSKSHNGGVKHLVVELHKTVQDILKQQNTAKPTKDEPMPPTNSQEPIINTHQVNPENHQPLPSSPANFPTTSVMKEPTRFEPFVPNFLQLEDGRKVMRKRPSESSFSRGGEERISQTHPGVDNIRPELRTSDSAANIDDCQELVSNCYEDLLDRKIVQLQSEMQRLEDQYWGNEV